MSRNLFSKYVWLVDTIRRKGQTGITFGEIQRQWELSRFAENDKPYSKRTFHHQKSEIEDLFDIVISCNRRTNCYYIECDSDSRESVRNWLFNTFAVSNILQEGESIREAILVEEVPSAQEYLTDLIRAIRESRITEISYRAFIRDETYACRFAPYFLKLHNRRWYVYGQDLADGKIRVLALDRIRQLSVTSAPFEKPAGFSGRAYLADCIGIARYDDIPACDIRVKAYGVQAKYVESLPLHTSQKAVETTKDYTVFSYHLCPTIEFYQEILRRGPDIEVLSPASVRNELKDILCRSLKKYN